MHAVAQAPALELVGLAAGARASADRPGWRGRSVIVAARAEADVAMERYAGGDDASFGLVYDALAPRLFGYLLRQTRQRARAEDLLQQTMLHIHRARASFITNCCP